MATASRGSGRIPGELLSRAAVSVCALCQHFSPPQFTLLTFHHEGARGALGPAALLVVIVGRIHATADDGHFCVEVSEHRVCSPYA